MAPGETIGVRKYAAELGTSNGPIRDALLQLRNEQLVEGGDGKGWKVTEITPALVEEGMIIREALEALTARYCAMRATPEDIVKLMKLAEEVDARFEAGLVLDGLTTELDERFHVMVAEVAGYARLREEIERWKVAMSWAQLSLSALNGRMWRSESHAEVVRAMASGDPDAAERQMRQHVLHPWLDWKQEIFGSDAAC